MWRVGTRNFSKLVHRPSAGSSLRVGRKFFGKNFVYRLLLTGTLVCTAGAVYMLQPKRKGKLSSNTSKYVQPAEVLELGVALDYQECYLVGVVKPNTLRIDPNTHKHSFVLTDFIHEIKVVYEGLLPSTFREGETARVQGEFVDEYNPTDMVATTVQGAHDAEKTKTTYQPRSKDINLKQRPF